MGARHQLRLAEPLAVLDRRWHALVMSSTYSVASRDTASFRVDAWLQLGARRRLTAESGRPRPGRRGWRSYVTAIRQATRGPAARRVRRRLFLP